MGLVSDLAPGFVRMSVLGASTSASYTEALALSLPGEVKKELDTVFSPAWDSKVVLVIGPEFKRSTEKDVIVENFLTGLHILVQQGQLAPDSAFAKVAIAALSQYLNPDHGPVTVLDPQRLNFVSLAQPGLETVIAKAMLASASL